MPEKLPSSLRGRAGHVVVFTDNDSCAHVMDYKQNLSQNIDDINQAVRNAKRLEYLVRHGGRTLKCRWTILNLYIQMEYDITWDDK